jgi:cytochrome c2
MASWRLWLAWLLAMGAGPGCGHEPARPQPVQSAEAPIAASPVPVPALHASAARGRELVQRYECNRCHEGTGLEAAPLERHCTQCHEQIASGSFRAPRDALSRWHATVEPLRDAPSLAALGRRLKSDWVVRFLEQPYDVRPHLSATMPRLALDHQQSLDIAAHLANHGGAQPDALQHADVQRGRDLIEQRACGSCHEFTGVPALPQRPDVHVDNAELRRAVRLAPDLRHTRERMPSGALVDWLVDPAAVKPGTRMPSFGFSRAEARDVASYLLSAPLEPLVAKAPATRLPLLARRVDYEEVDQKVFRVTCRHCHGDPEILRGDGGPGNTGGFGFPMRGLNLASYAGLASGLLRNGERQSVFADAGDGTPLLVRSLLARQREEAGGVDSGARGMPLGLPALTPEQIQLVESWVAQGRPR